MRMEGRGSFVGAVPLSHLHSPLLNARSGAQLTVQANSALASDFGTEKGLLQGYARRWVAYALKSPAPQNFCQALKKILYLE